MNVVVSQHKLYVAQLRKKDLNVAALPILKILLFSNDIKFFSFTDTTTEISIVMEERLLEVFPSGLLELSPKVWRSLEIVNSTYSGISTGVHSISSPLANAGISIFYISTYETDIILIPDEDITKAVHCLKQSFPLLSTNFQYSISSVPPLSPPSKSSHSNKKHKLSLNSNTLILTSTQKYTFNNIGTTIIGFLFFPEKDKRFFSLCATGETVSIILEESDYVKLNSLVEDDELSSYNDIWQRISVDDGPLGFEETGIVNSIAAPLAKVDINVFYVCTFETDHLLLRQSDVQKAVNTLKTSGFILK
uniref:CASTOR ACT domain-containing protein n=1 Tax=Arcella intermedia TaxID=1963864 RepID=A0A6B2LB17_9EUKA